jgi:sugar phosphate isomerase/epimerase
MPVPLGTRTSDDDFAGLVETVRTVAPRLADAGVTTMSAWLAPANDESAYDETFALHRRRLNALAPILSGSGLRLALEYVGPATWRTPFTHPFISDLAGMRALIASLDDPARCGLLLDTFHWFTAGESLADIRALSADEILAVDLNDAPTGVERDAQLDMERAQPGATGVIDAAGFVAVLREIGYDGPVQSEPFSAALREQPEEERVVDAHRALVAAGAA